MLEDLDEGGGGSEIKIKICQIDKIAKSIKLLISKNRLSLLIKSLNGFNGSSQLLFILFVF